MARTAELMRAVARSLLEDSSAGLAQVDAASLGAAPAELRSDPVLVASARATTYANLVHYLSQVVVDPSVPVQPVHSPEALDLARDLVRRGLDTQSLGTYRAGQNAAWQAWMAACFQATSDPDELQDLLRESAQSIFAYVEATLASITALVEGEREGLVHSTHTQRLEAVSLVLDGALVDAGVASARLGHDLRPPQVAAVLWRDPGSAEVGQLEQAAQAVGAVLGRSRPLTVVATALSLWAWYPTDVLPAADEVARATAGSAGVRVALGAGGPGVDGFRRSHLDALATQRLMLRAGPELRVASYPDVEVVELLASNEERAHELVQRTLGPLLQADPVLRETLRTYLREGMSASRTARALFAHRNTVLNRLERAEQLLPQPLAGRSLNVALALEVVHWLGSPGGELPPGQG